MQHPIRFAAVMAAALLALTACDTGSGQPGGDGASTTASDPDFAGRWVADDPADAFLEFEMVDEYGGLVSGSDGCNGVGGEFHVDGDSARIERQAGTLKGCVGVDPWLEDVSAVEIDGDTMIVQNGDGEEIGTLTRDEDADEDAIPTITPTASIDEAEDDSDS